MDEPGDLIGPFRRLKALGRGSHGEVFLAERVQPFEQRVAIKMLDAGDGADEAGSLTALDHPHIVKLLDRGTTGHRNAYLVMEYVDGEPIDAYCERHALPCHERLVLLGKVMDALAHAHRHLVVHADLKPSNILVTADGTPKVLDFGVAQVLPDGIGDHTPEFASPEQRDGRPLSVTTDVYSLGLLAHHLLRGMPVDADLHAILAAATQPVPEDRYPSMEALGADVRRVLRGEEVSVRPVGRIVLLRRTLGRHVLASVTALSIALILVAGAWVVLRDAAVAQRERRLAQLQLRQLVELTGTLEGELYDSAGLLPQSADARRVLLQGASQTLDKLAARHDDDAEFAAELAVQYATLARARRELGLPDASRTGAGVATSHQE